MAVLTSTGITFSDSTSQSTAATAAALVTTANVLSATAWASAGAVGTYCMAYAFSGNVSIGGTIAGNQIQYSSSDGANRSGSPAGTWRVMGYSAEGATTIYLRIS
jgi:hypothetical protein